MAPIQSPSAVGLSSTVPSPEERAEQIDALIENAKQLGRTEREKEIGALLYAQAEGRGQAVQNYLIDVIRALVAEAQARSEVEGAKAPSPSTSPSE